LYATTTRGEKYPVIPYAAASRILKVELSSISHMVRDERLDYVEPHVMNNETNRPFRMIVVNERFKKTQKNRKLKLAKKAKSIK